MFAPVVAKLQTKIDARASTRLPPHRLMLRAQPSGSTLGHIDNVGQQPPGLANEAENAGPRQTGLPWNFGKISIFPSIQQIAREPGLFQRKLEIGAAHDPLEHEADRIADQMMGTQYRDLPIAAAQVQRRCAECSEEANEEKSGLLGKGELDDNLLATGRAQSAQELPAPEEEEEGSLPARETALAKVEPRVLCKQSAPGGAGSARATFAPEIVGQVLQGDGQPLEHRTRVAMERRFGHDFSGVRVHVGERASASAETIHALAYTVGGDIVFRSGRYDPGSLEGQRLLAHELTHVVQQGAAPRSAGRQDGRVKTAGQVTDRVQRAVATAIAADGAPSHALTGCTWGFTFPESVDETCVAAKSGATWKADPTSLQGHFSEQTRLVPAEVEVTGPGGNTTSANHCEQVGELKRLGDCPGKWYMLAAVVAHENVHAAHFGPALASAAPDIQADFNAVTVPDAPGKTDATALTELKALPAYATAKGKMQPKWLQKVLTLVAGDHGGPAAAAEHTVVDPMVTRICSHAKANAWPACGDCPP